MTPIRIVDRSAMLRTGGESSRPHAHTASLITGASQMNWDSRYDFYMACLTALKILWRF